jgi:hypothetical protein
MDLNATHTFDAPLADVWAMFCNVDAHVAKFDAMGHRNIEVLEHSADDDHVRVVITRLIDVELPGFARKVLKPTNTVVSTDEWQADGKGGYRGEFRLEAQGQPVLINGTTHISADGDDRTRYETTVSVQVKVPLIGGRIADWAKGDVKKQTDDEFAAGDRWLAEHR